MENDEEEGSKLGAVAPHQAAALSTAAPAAQAVATAPDEPPDRAARPRGSSASPVASPIGKGLKRPPAPRKKVTASGTGAASDSDAAEEAPRPRSGSENRQRSHVVRMRLDDEELAKLDDRATASGLSVGAYLRAASLKSPGVRAKPRASVDRELLARTNADLNRVGNNINQIAAALNRGAEPPLVVGEAMAELRCVLAVLRRAAGYDSQG